MVRLLYAKPNQKRIQFIQKGQHLSIQTYFENLESKSDVNLQSEIPNIGVSPFMD